MNEAERSVMRHATGWETLQELCRRGWMRVSRQPSELSGGDYVFSVTPAGRDELQRDDDETRPPGARERLRHAVWAELDKLSDAALQSWITRGYKSVSGLARALLELRARESETQPEREES